MAFTKDSPAFKQLLKYNREQTQFLADFLTARGRQVFIPNSMRSKGSNISLYLADEPANMQGVAVRVDLWVNKTGNILVETAHKRRQLNGTIKDEKGWYHTCFADSVFVIDPIGNKIYQFNWRLLKAFVTQGGPNIDFRTWVNKTDEATTTSAYFVKLRALKDEGILICEWNID